MNSPPEPSAFRIHLVATLLGGSSAMLVAAHLLTAAMRLDLGKAPWGVSVALIAWTVALVMIPRHASYSIFLAIPLFGNRPGGALLEFLNLLVAATTLGLTFRAWRQRRPPPGGTLWLCALLVLLSAGLALVATLPDAAVRAAQIGVIPSLVAQTLTAAETVPLYAVGSMVQLLIAVAWAYALSWAGSDLAFARNALRYLALGLFAVMVVGVLGLHGLIDIRTGLLMRIDPHIDYAGLQSVFWNPAWFAMYFTMALGLSIGLLWLERGAARVGVALGLTVSYAYFLANRQRGGFLAVQAVVLAALAASAWGRRRSWRALTLAVASLLLPLLLVWSGLVGGVAWLLPVQRLLGPEVDINRWTLWMLSLEMWRSSPLFGIGEGAFGWHYRVFQPEGSEGDIGAWGTAHSTWLQILATRGILGLVAFLALLGAMGGRALAAARSSGSERGIGFGLSLGLVAFIIYGTVQWMFYVQSIQVLFWGMVALAAAAVSGETARASPSWRRRGLFALALIAAVALQMIRTRPLYERAAADIARQPHGFYGLSHWAGRGEPMRWSSKTGTLWLYPTGPVMTLQVLTTDPWAETRPVTVTLKVEDRVLDRFDLGRRTTRRSMFLPESYRYRPPPSPPAFGERLPARPALPLTVEVSRLWTPYLSGSLDGRFLGVAVFAPSFRAPEAGEELGVVPSPLGVQPGVSWTGARWSQSIDLTAHPTELVVPLRPAGWDGTPVVVEALWDQRAVASLRLTEDRWQHLRIDLPGGARRGVLTLQADRVWPLARTGPMGERQYAALQVRLPRDLRVP